MHEDLVRFLTDHGTLLILAVTALAAVILVQWRKARAHELDLAFKQELLERGMTAADIEKLLTSQAPGRKGLIEQFGALSAGTRTGLIVGFVIVVTVVVSVIAGAIQGHAFWSHVRRQQEAPRPGPTGTPPAAGQGKGRDARPAHPAERKPGG